MLDAKAVTKVVLRSDAKNIVSDPLCVFATAVEKRHAFQQAVVGKENCEVCKDATTVEAEAQIKNGRKFLVVFAICHLAYAPSSKELSQEQREAKQRSILEHMKTLELVSTDFPTTALQLMAKAGGTAGEKATQQS